MRFIVNIEKEADDGNQNMGACYIELSGGDARNASYKFRITKINSSVTFKSGEVHGVRGRSPWYILMKCISVAFPSQQKIKHSQQ